ncbi:protein-arginine deiminase domain-containing protein [Streptomyces caniscabiei]|uniref:protein-arginine deiminase domain-containing protein n=1 Tax=Streptomyces caniscabiei TaxID=2746961 RepID=UPI003AF3273C
MQKRHRATRKGRAVPVLLALAAAGSVLAVPALASGPDGPDRADLRADVDRDGAVDVLGESDTTGEDSWSTGRGAVVLPNIDDDGKRCPVAGSDGKPLTDDELASCNDATDTRVNGAADAADLARVRSVPMKDLPDGAAGRVSVSAGAAHSRVFLRQGDTWVPVERGTRLSAAELRSGAVFGVEATDIIRNSAVWDGRVRIRLSVTSSDGLSSDDVTLRVAPLLTHHHLQKTEQVMVSKLPADTDFARGQHEFVNSLGRAVKAAGVTKPLVTLDGYDEIWTQDFVEPAYVSMTGADGHRQAMRIMLRSAQPDREAGRELFEKLRGPNVGAVQVSGVRDSEEWTLNSMGNLETIPPYTHGGESFPAGRVIMGERKDNGSKPAQAMRTLLRSQGLQDPLLLDTSWLYVGHVDEFVQFLPADTPRGWRIGVADPEAGMQLLRGAQRDGHGSTKMFSAPGTPDVPAPTETIDQALASRTLATDNTRAAELIEANLDVLRRETGVTDDEIVRVPALFTRGTLQEDSSGDKTRMPLLKQLGGRFQAPEETSSLGQQGLLDALAGGGNAGKAAAPATQTSAYVPGAVNGIMLDRKHYLAPRQWGPVVGGNDIFTQAVTAAYAGAGLKVSYLDGWSTYHLNMGEIHCATNTLRDVSAAWWTQ